MVKTNERRRYKGGEISIYDPTHMQELNASEFIRKSFEQAGCLGFCQKVQEVGYHHDLTSLFTTSFKKDRAIIAGVKFPVSAEVIALATTIPNQGEIWFKGMDLYLEHYKMFLKPQYKECPSHIFPGKKFLDKYNPLMNIIMKYFTCEGRFNRLYQYHIRLLMHFTSMKPLNLLNYMFRSLLKMTDKVQSKGRHHQSSLFHHVLVKVIVLHQLSQINMSWESFLETSALSPISN